MTLLALRGVRAIMSVTRIAALVLLVITVPLAGAFAGGAGGVAWSDQHYIAGLSNSTIAVSEVGGFGYGVNSSGQRAGGFGYAIYSPEGLDRISGGVGGFIVGQEGRAGPFTLAGNLWMGLGGVSATISGAQSGHVILFGEANLELGVAVTPWMQLSAYCGMQGMSDVNPDTGIGYQIARYAPVFGMRLAWGSFNARW